MGLLTTLKQNDVFRDEYSLAFDGTNDYVHTNFVASNEGITNDVTVSCWFKAADLAASSNAFVWNFYQSTSDGFGVKFSSSTFKVINDIDDADANLYTTTLDINKWYLAVVVIDSLEVKLYINGVLEGSGTSVADGLDSFTSNFYIANRKGAAGTGEFNGNISEIAIYDSALTANQVKTIYNGREPYNHKEGVASGNLQAWYRMGDGVIDDYALIGDETNPTLGSNLITSFTNGSTYVFDTLSTSGNNISSAIETSGDWAGAVSNSLNLTDGEIYKCTFDLTYNSGDDTLRVLLVNAANGAATSVVDVVYYTNTNGSNVFYFKVKTTDSEAFLQLGTWHSSDVINFSATNITLQKVNGNAGYMFNMSATDIEGDTP